MNLSEHFTLAEMIQSDYAARNGLDNAPSQEVIINLRRLCLVLEKVREVLGKPIIVSSGYRSALVNNGVGGVATSYHCQGLAVDFKSPFGTPYEVATAIVGALDIIKYDKVIHEFRAWTHLQIPKVGESPRGEAYTILTASQGYVKGVLA